MNKKLIISVLLTAFIIAGTCFSLTSQSTYKNTKVYAAASWYYGYGNLKELVKESDIIAIVRIGDKVEEWEQNNIPLTTYNAIVIDPIVNSIKGENIGITITGINNGKSHFEIMDDPLFQMGEEFLIFARKNDWGTYTILGGPQGRFKHQNGKLYSMKHVTNKVNTGLIDIDGESVDKVKSEIFTK